MTQLRDGVLLEAEDMVTLQTRPNEVLLRTDISIPSSKESFHHSCLGIATSSSASFCITKPLWIAKCRWNNLKKRLLPIECSRVATESAIPLPSEGLAPNTERTFCKDLAAVATLSDTLQSFSVTRECLSFAKRGYKASNDGRFAANESAEADRRPDEKEKEEDDGQDKQLQHHTSSLPLEKDAHSVVSEDEMRIINEERLRRKRISEANKNQVPWNKGKGRGMKSKAGMQSNNGATISNHTTPKALESDAELLIKEKQRRQRIAAARTGMAPWNKGRGHSEEARQRIRERTSEAMKSPKVRDKLRVRSILLSNETKSKIKAAMVRSWEERKKLESVQGTCLKEWKEFVADGARRGFDGDVTYSWHSYGTILRELKHTWRVRNKRRCCKEEKILTTSAHRVTVANGDISWSSMETALCTYQEKQDSENEEVKEKREGTLKSREAIVTSGETCECTQSDQASKPCGDSTHRELCKCLPPYRNPSNPEMLERLKQIRAKRRLKESNQRRAFKETNRRRAVERARILMERAQMAARALQAQAATDEGALLSLRDAQQLLSEAAESLKAAGLEKKI